MNGVYNKGARGAALRSKVHRPIKATCTGPEYLSLVFGLEPLEQCSRHISIDRGIGIVEMTFFTSTCTSTAQVYSYYQISS